MNAEIIGLSSHFRKKKKRTNSFNKSADKMRWIWKKEDEDKEEEKKKKETTLESTFKKNESKRYYLNQIKSLNIYLFRFMLMTMIKTEAPS